MSGTHSKFMHEFLRFSDSKTTLFSVYVETGRKESAATVKITTGSTSYSRIWKIKVNYIQCFSTMRAPFDCQQYFTGVSGTFESYSFSGSHVMTSNQEYGNCFRQERGYCAMDLSLADSGTSPDYFDLSGTDANVKRTASSCNNNARLELVVALSHQSTIGPAEAGVYFCGGQFGIRGGQTISSVVRSK